MKRNKDLGRVITLTSDFGNRDPFVGIMKGVILSIYPEARIVDLTHEISPFDLLLGALVLARAWTYFPRGTIHLVIVDPGVGTQRKSIAVRAGGHYFVGPDNGVMSLAWQGQKGFRAVEIMNPKFMLKEISSTFNGRDLFAPAAAHLANEVPLNDLGPPVGVLEKIELPEVRHTREGIEGEVIAFDKFGNAITNLKGLAAKGTIRVKGKTIKMAKAYGDAGKGAPVALRGSSGFLEIAVNQGSAQEALGLVKGTKVSLKERLR